MGAEGGRAVSVLFYPQAVSNLFFPFKFKTGAAVESGQDSLSYSFDAYCDKKTVIFLILCARSIYIPSIVFSPVSVSHLCFYIRNSWPAIEYRLSNYQTSEVEKTLSITSDFFVQRIQPCGLTGMDAYSSNVRISR